MVLKKKENISQEDHRKFLSLAFFHVVILAVILSITGYYYQQSQKDIIIRKIENVNKEELEKINMTLTGKVSEFILPIKIISEIEIINQYFAYGSNDNEYVLKDLIKSFSTELESFVQVKLIRGNGDEVLKSVYKDGMISFSDDLNNVSDTEYFNDMKKLGVNDMYITSFDDCPELDFTETSFKIGKRIINNNHVTVGFIIISIDGKVISDLLDELNEEYPEIFLLNQNGSYMLSMNNDEFLTEDEQISTNTTFSMMHEEIWNEFLSGNQSHFDDEDGHFYFEEIKLDNNDQYQWLLVRNVKPESIKESFDKEGLTTIFIFLVLFLILSPTTVVFFYYREVNKKYREEIENNVKYDVLTGLYNRRQALIELRNKSNYYRRYGGNFVIAYIDINSLKYVNDEYGHDMGDTLLKGFSEIVKDEIRGTDVACRMGGDEFIIMFDQCNETDAYHIIIRITKYFKERGKLFMDFPWTFAYGIKRYDKNLEMDELLILADKAMYEHKNEMKKQDKSLDR